MLYYSFYVLFALPHFVCMARAMTIDLKSAVSCASKFAVGPSQKPPRFILGSSSRSRYLLLEATGADFEVMTPNINEEAIGSRAGDPQALVRLIATAKADALLERLSLENGNDNRILLTGDQVVTYDGVIREKPVDLKQCRQFIQSYSRNPCCTVGAICLHSLATGKRVLGVHEAFVHFKEIPDKVIDQLIEQDGPLLLQCAGGLMIEHDLIQPFVHEVHGGIDSIMGLCTNLLVDLLDELHNLEKQEDVRMR
uniref:Maf-like protein n=1 Tax=Aureoumbra lagunensis TaxID=44058 RepID=A0A7S3K499_9STRA|mmetsp:Transcript_3454/g.4386  ORF Transcript_3454/g.4386 Transcript_3454/m.4386 type:complete len:253 (+) Transcript_3454:14-772(+)